MMNARLMRTVTRSIVGPDGILPETREFIAFLSLDWTAIQAIASRISDQSISALAIVSLAEVLVILARS